MEKVFTKRKARQKSQEQWKDQSLTISYDEEQKEETSKAPWQVKTSKTSSIKKKLYLRLFFLSAFQHLYI